MMKTYQFQFFFKKGSEKKVTDQNRKKKEFI